MKRGRQGFAKLLSGGMQDRGTVLRESLSNAVDMLWAFMVLTSIRAMTECKSVADTEGTRPNSSHSLTFSGILFVGTSYANGPYSKHNRIFTAAKRSVLRKRRTPTINSLGVSQSRVRRS